MQGHAGPARPSIQELVTLVPDDGSADEVVDVARRRFGARSWPRGAVGSTGALIEHFGHLADLGVERVYTWFTDFAVPDTLERFQVVIDALTD
jgi:hypothetical protein